MKSVDRLIKEHDLIERGLTLLEASAARIASGQAIPDGFASWAAGFFSEFADRCHHAKEEDLFFPLLHERGIPQEGGPIGVMLHEHDLGRSCVQRMKQAGAAQPFDATLFATAAREFVPLLRQHIFKENNVLFRMAGSVLTEDDDAEMDRQFSAVEQERELDGLYDRCEREISRWESETA